MAKADDISKSQNPLLDADLGETLINIQCVLSYLQISLPDYISGSENKQADEGIGLILRCAVGALKALEERHEAA